MWFCFNSFFDFYRHTMADTDASAAEAVNAPAPAAAPAAGATEDEPTPGADVNTGASENLREVSLSR